MQKRANKCRTAVQRLKRIMGYHGWPLGVHLNGELSKGQKKYLQRKEGEKKNTDACNG